MNYSVMNEIMSLLACICIVLVFVEFQFLVDGPRMSFCRGNHLSAGFADMLQQLQSSNNIYSSPVENQNTSTQARNEPAYVFLNNC